MADSLASQIITAIGGPENVRSLTHCATRLRFELADASKVDQNALEHMKGVLGAVPQSGDRFQVVIGGGVATVYENIMHLPEMANAGAASASGEGQKSNADVKAEARSKARGKVAWLDSFFEYLADSFRPILGVLLGASIIIALVNLLISLNVIPNDEASAGWVFVKAIWKGEGTEIGHEGLMLQKVHEIALLHMMERRNLLDGIYPDTVSVHGSSLQISPSPSSTGGSVFSPAVQISSSAGFTLSARASSSFCVPQALMLKWMLCSVSIHSMTLHSAGSSDK